MAIRRRLRTVIFAVAFIFTVAYFFTSLPSSAGPRLLKSSLGFKRSTFDWSTVKEHFPVQSLTPLPTGAPKRLPKVQFDFEYPYRENKTIEQRRNAVRDAFLRSWTSYKKHAWLHDELEPVSGGARDPFGGWAATLVDSLDTMWIMGLEKEFHEAAAAAVRIDWNRTDETGINLFETTIRHLGGLLSAYDLSGETALLMKAKELGNLLYMAFDTPNRMPGFWLTFENVKSGLQIAGKHDPSAVPTSLSLEFTRLAQLTGDNKYYDAIDRIRAFLERSQEETHLPGMWPTMINFAKEDVRIDKSFTLGALADSLYEYLPKMYILLSGRDEASSYEKMYRRAMDVVIKHILFRPMLPDGNDILFAGNSYVTNDKVISTAESQHLACFVGGMFGLGGKIFDISEHVDIGNRLARGCGWAYQSFPTGLMPEIFNLIRCESLNGCEWDEEKWTKEGSQALPHGFKNARDARYILRPEAIESVFILYRITGKEDLRDMAWDMFTSIMKATKTQYANSAIRSVTVTGETEKDNTMESFWLAETLKYFYLIFSPPDVISLDKYVFNTEAHPLKRFDWSSP
ncbi:glycoside hydrolase family 47 protein [Xylogone sp. PMI_703]|nr:glycoside hydrolase family 47 protein [Xylogone sp. PMI_703]